MKHILYVAILAIAMTSCESQKYEDQRCKGLLLDSLTNLSKYRDRVICLETGACGMAKDYQMKIEALEKTIDSLTKQERKIKGSIVMREHHSTKLVKKTKHTRMVAPQSAQKTEPAVTVKKSDNSRPFYYSDVKQKYFFYDDNRKQYYSVDRETGEKHYAEE
ncbi:MAG: hypothetical protein JST82_13150 [Bacteroidetes bacterium]|nr:hypothetical protein [Bacteroidota bacterium]